MARCEDFPCCGHEMGCCPRRDESGRQIEMVCVCGASVPLHSRSSLCPACLWGDGDEDGGWDDEDEDGDWDDGDCSSCRGGGCRSCQPSDFF